MSRKAERKAWTEYFEAKSAVSLSTDAPSTTRNGAGHHDAPSNGHASSRHGVKSIDFIVDTEPIPQGSMGGICTTREDGTPVTVLKSDNPRLHPFRRLVGLAAVKARASAGVYEVFAGPGVPVRVAITFVFERPKTAPRSRIRPTVKPDIDKLTRACMDALTGILYHDDAQVVDDEHHKIYGTPERVCISVQIVEE